MNTAISPKPQSHRPMASLPKPNLRFAKRRTLTPVQPSLASPAENSPLEVQIASLKLLAISLLRQIDSLEHQAPADQPAELDLQTEVRRFEAELIRNALLKTKGKQRRAARLLGMKVTTLNTKIKRYGINVAGNSDESTNTTESLA